MASKFATLLQKFVETCAEQDLPALQLFVPYVLSSFERGRGESTKARLLEQCMSAYKPGIKQRFHRGALKAKAGGPRNARRSVDPAVCQRKPNEEF